MDQRARRTTLDAAEWDVVIGWSTGIGIVFLRVVASVGVLAGAGPIDWVVLSQILVQLPLVAALTYGVYRRQGWAAVGLLVVWGLPYFYSWYALGRWFPPLGLIGILVWIGLYRGLRGVGALADAQTGSVRVV